MPAHGPIPRQTAPARPSRLRSSLVSVHPISSTTGRAAKADSQAARPASGSVTAGSSSAAGAISPAHSSAPSWRVEIRSCFNGTLLSVPPIRPGGSPGSQGDLH